MKWGLNTQGRLIAAMMWQYVWFNAKSRRIYIALGFSNLAFSFFWVASPLLLCMYTVFLNTKCYQLQRSDTCTAHAIHVFRLSAYICHVHNGMGECEQSTCISSFFRFPDAAGHITHLTLYGYTDIRTQGHSWLEEIRESVRDLQRAMESIGCIQWKYACLNIKRSRNQSIELCYRILNAKLYSNVSQAKWNWSKSIILSFHIISINGFNDAMVQRLQQFSFDLSLADLA